ncbi:tight adherence protein B [Saccharopolyspora antimicrobica]|uniref:Tight adherence protein B n=1 Tax=Saccharopolyspora antimicrobica TaxID=455193 RepID=A0A1I5G0M3_9PSEU|nr:type II secretion system F family protein [Saccharopolyspora antimicrobica]RKT83990.1 tight adherence protein B [Saccharopolyspora antimicrobica]SFO29423.1 tight adherence protein B [Saccharopolyspora antimicrobica]
MLILALLLAAVAMLCWPEISARDRLRPRQVRTVLGPVRNTRFLVVPTAAVGGLVLAGPAGLLVGTGLALLGGHHWRSLRGRRARLVRADELTAGLRLLVAQLRAGAHPASAAEGAAAEAGPAVAGVFRDMAATVRLGGDVAAVLRCHDLVELRAPLGRVARAWVLAERHGVALADLLDAVRRDVERRTAFRRGVEAKLAGPRSTAAVLTGLPVCGLLFGEALGAAPLAVLNDGMFGQLLLLVGAALLAAGASWTLRLTEVVQS